MNHEPRRRAGRWVAVTAAGALLTAGNLLLTAQPASAATTATFLANGGGVLSVFGDNLPNAIAVSRNAAGTLLVNGGAVPVAGGTSTVANTQRIQVFGLGGADVIALSETNGALPPAALFGGADNDVLTGGSSNDQLFGQAGNDTLLGKGGFDLLFGGTENDILTGGDADDQVFGEAGDDRTIWNAGDDTDLNEGAAGTDTVEVNGGNGAENFTVLANGVRVRFDRLTPSPFSIDIGTSERIVLNANGGNDTVTAGNGLAALVRLSVDGGAGNDNLRGGDGDDLLLGGDGDDVVAGQRGNDTALLGAGADSFQWDPGDGNDVVEGQAGTDQMIFNGSNVSEQVDVTANGGRVRFTRNVANVTMDLNDLEDVVFHALGGADTTVVHDLSGTDVDRVVADLASERGGTAPDGAADNVRVEGTFGDDVVSVTGSAADRRITGLAAEVEVLHADDLNTDRVTVAALAGDDVVDATTATAPASLTIDGGNGDDVLIGGFGDDVILGGDGDDVLIGGPGNDLLDGGTGDNVLISGETLANGLVANQKWLANHARAVRGGVEFDLGAKRLRAPVTLQTLR